MLENIFIQCYSIPNLLIGSTGIDFFFFHLHPGEPKHEKLITFLLQKN